MTNNKNHDLNTYSKTYISDPNHIDVQGIMDGLYYPFYMEECRHSFIREILGFDFETEARNGIFMVLSKYTINFLRPLKRDDEFIVTCSMFSDNQGLPKLHFKQAIILNGKVMTDAVFTGTCIPSKGGRPFLPESIKTVLLDLPGIAG